MRWSEWTVAELKSYGRASRDFLESIESELLGWSAVPVQRLLEEADWSPDLRSRYCTRCGETVGQGEQTETGCGACRERSVAWNNFVRLGPHTDPLREWVHAIKYSGWADLGEHLGYLLGQRIEAADVLTDSRPVIIPMPMPWQRRLYRGIDHAQTIAAGVGRALHGPVARVLSRELSVPQVSLPESSRRRATQRVRIKRSHRKWSLAEVDVILVDDVRTTSASLRAAAKALRPLEPRRVIAGVLTVADAKGRRSQQSDQTAAYMRSG